MLGEISYEQLVEWMVFAQQEPFDETRADLRSASIVATLINLHRKKGARLLSANEVRFRFGDDTEGAVGVKPQQSPKEQVMMMQMLASMFGAQTQKAA